ncbi:transcription factor bHLH101-like [Cucurbita maxima]|uniref:Transcription factor bHLH101-like n=1 Tax=Cucurbita maxima TaxID=3661 RepID=A0A6J1HRN3_CUCMA|nr:transcription factor bHLH101-like [Cucurbita maxima]
MLAMIPSSSTTHGGWIPGNPQSTNGRSSELFIQFSSPQPSHHVKVESCSPPSAGDGRHRGGGGFGSDDPVAVAKKLKHNASERDRRKKMNSLYTSLRCLLPSTNRTKTMSNPATISRALKYIPELRQQVEELRRRKQGLETKINAITHDQQKQVRKNKDAPWMGCSSCAVNWLRENEALLQLTSNDTLKLKFSQILHSLDEDELLVKTVSTFRLFDGRHFFTLLVQAKPNTPSRVLQEILNKMF